MWGRGYLYFHVHKWLSLQEVKRKIFKVTYQFNLSVYLDSLIPSIHVLYIISWASYQTRKNCGLRMRQEYQERFPRHRLKRKPLISDLGMHHGTCMTHVPWCISGSLPPVRGKRSRHSRRMRTPQFCVSGKRPILTGNVLTTCFDLVPVDSPIPYRDMPRALDQLFYCTRPMTLTLLTSVHESHAFYDDVISCIFMHNWPFVMETTGHRRMNLK